MTDESIPSADDASAAKPPAQTVAAVGHNDSASHAIRQALGGLPAHPPFQMFIEGQAPNEAGIDAVRYATERATAMAGQSSPQAVVNAYLAWWTEKGYWKGESPYGKG